MEEARRWTTEGDTKGAFKWTWWQGKGDGMVLGPLPQSGSWKATINAVDFDKVHSLRIAGFNAMDLGVTFQTLLLEDIKEPASGVDLAVGSAAERCAAKVNGGECTASGCCMWCAPEADAPGICLPALVLADGLEAADAVCSGLAVYPPGYAWKLGGAVVAGFQHTCLNARWEYGIGLTLACWGVPRLFPRPLSLTWGTRRAVQCG